GSKSKLWRAEDVRGAGHDGDQDSSDGNHLVREVEDRENRQQVTIGAETAGVHANAKIKDGEPGNRGHAQPPGCGIRRSGKGQNKSRNARYGYQNPKNLRESNVIRQGLPKDLHNLSPPPVYRMVAGPIDKM